MLFLLLRLVQNAVKKPLMSANNDIYDIESLQRGARNFMNYCSGCHSAEYIRYDVIGEDLGITQFQQRISYVRAQQTFDTINASMTSEDAWMVWASTARSHTCRSS